MIFTFIFEFLTMLRSCTNMKLWKWLLSPCLLFFHCRRSAYLLASSLYSLYLYEYLANFHFYICSFMLIFLSEPVSTHPLLKMLLHCGTLCYAASTCSNESFCYCNKSYLLSAVYLTSWSTQRLWSDCKLLLVLVTPFCRINFYSRF